MQRFRQMRTLQKFASVHASVHNHFNLERSLHSRQNFKANRTAALGPSGAASVRHNGRRHRPCRDWFAFV